MPRPNSDAETLLPVVIERRIYLIRKQKVMLDNDLAELYQVSTKVLNQAVKRNRDRFPRDFMFQLTLNEARAIETHRDGTNLRSQIVTSSYGGRRYTPYAFTEQGVAMLSSVLRSERAIQVNIAIMRAFVRLREILATNRELAAKLEEIEQRYDSQFRVVFEVIKKLMNEPKEPSRGKLGFTSD